MLHVETNSVRMFKGCSAYSNEVVLGLNAPPRHRWRMMTFLELLLWWKLPALVPDLGLSCSHTEGC